MKQEKSKWSKKVNYEVPEEYFDNLAQRIQQKTATPSPTTKQRFGLWKPVLGFGLCLLLMVVVFYPKNDPTPPIVSIEELDKDVIEDYLADETMGVEWQEGDLIEEVSQLDDLDLIYFDELDNDDILDELEVYELLEYEI